MQLLGSKQQTNTRIVAGKLTLTIPSVIFHHHTLINITIKAVFIQFRQASNALFIKDLAMTSERLQCGRRSQMLDVIAEAPAILSSSTDQLENSLWPSKTMFLENYPSFGEDLPWKVDDQNIDLMALAVLDDFSPEVCTERYPKIYVQKSKLSMSPDSQSYPQHEHGSYGRTLPLAG